MVVDDGVQIARDFDIDDPAERAVVENRARSAVENNDRAADGTTGAAIVLQSIINEAARRIDALKIEPRTEAWSRAK